MFKRNRSVAGASVRKSHKSVAVGGDNYGDIYIGAGAEGPAEAAEHLAGIVQKKWEKEAKSSGIDVGLIDVKWEWAAFAPQPDYVSRKSQAGSLLRPLPGIASLVGHEVPR